VKAIVSALLTLTVLVSVAVNAIRWRLPNQPRLGLLLARKIRRRSPRAELAIELGMITAACIVLPVAAIGLTVLVVVIASHVG
jgi:hypothetical protein